MIRKIAFEILGTFVLVFLTGVTEERGRTKKTNFSRDTGENFLNGAFVGFAVYVALFYIGRKISGCHLNPAVSFAMVFIKKITLVEGIVFGICQLVAGFFAALLVMPFMSDMEEDLMPVSSISIGYFQALLLEIQMSAIFIFIFINSEVSKNVADHLKGFLIGSGYLITTCATFRFTMGGTNPAKSLPLNFIRGYFDSTHVYLFAPFIGAIFSVVRSKAFFYLGCRTLVFTIKYIWKLD